MKKGGGGIRVRLISSVNFEGVRVPLTPDDPSRECTAVLLPKPRKGGGRSLGRQERT